MELRYRLYGRVKNSVTSSLAREGRGGFLKRPRLAKNRELRLLPINNQALRNTVKRKIMKIKTSKYNEVRLSDVAQYIKVPAQIVRPSTPNGILIGDVKYEDGKKERVYSDYEVRINNVQLSFSVGEDSYFNSEIEIN